MQEFRVLYGHRLRQEKARGNIYTVDLTAPLAFEAVWTLAKTIQITQGATVM